MQLLKIYKENKMKFNSYLACAYAEGFCEGENATDKERLQAWAYIIKYGLWKHLQGWYGRTANNLIENGIISKTGRINWKNMEGDIND